MLYSPNRAAKAVPYGDYLMSFLFNNCVGYDFDTSKVQFSEGLFFGNVLFTNGVDGVDGRNTKSVLKFSLVVCILIMYVYS